MMYEYINPYELVAYDISTVQLKKLDGNECRLVYIMVHPSNRMPDIKMTITQKLVNIPYKRNELFIDATLIGGGYTSSGCYLVQKSREMLELQFYELAKGLLKCMCATNATNEIATPSGAKTHGPII